MEGIRVAIGQIGRARMVPPRTMKRYEARAASTATERRAIETIHAIYWTFLRDLFKTASALNRHQGCRLRDMQRSEEHTSELQSLMRISYAVFCLKKKKQKT